MSDLAVCISALNIHDISVSHTWAYVLGQKQVKSSEMQYNSSSRLGALILSPKLIEM